MNPALCTQCLALVGMSCERSCRCGSQPPYPEDEREAQQRIRCIPCLVCGLAIARGHNKWCRRVCRSCQERAQALNLAVGRCVVPIEVHSLVNGVGLRGGPATADQRNAAVAQFVAQAQELQTTVDHVYDFSDSLLRSRLQRFGLMAEPTAGWDVYLGDCGANGVSADGAWDALFGILDIDEA